MKLVLAFTGSRGDVQPAVALGVALSSRGHDVRMAVPPNLVEFSSRAGLDTSPYGPDTKSLLDSDLVARQLKSTNPVTRVRAVSELTIRGGRQMQAELLDLTADADAVIGGSAGQERVLNVADARDIAYLPLHYCPVRRNRVVSLLPGVQGLVSYASWVGLEQTLWQATRKAETTLAADLRLPAPGAPAATRIARRRTPEIQAYDPVLFPGLGHEWGHRRPIVGFFDLACETRTLVDGAPDDELGHWLDAGPPPVYVGFGSMTVADPGRLARSIVEATADLDLRVLVAAGWSGFMSDEDTQRIRVEQTIDHRAVLPRCAAAIHHGGAGSTAASLRAGVPTLVCWIGADQPMWGRRLRASGAGDTIKLADLDRASLRTALAGLLAPERRERAKAIAAELIPPEWAVESAADIVERTKRTRRRPMERKCLSVVVPAYNEADVIGDCLERLIAQRDSIAEIIVVDNNSTDDTAVIVKQFTARFPEVRLVGEQEQGLVYARNTGLDLASGDLIARIDADTRVPPQWAATIVDFFANDTVGHWAAACGRGEAYGLPYGNRLGSLKQRLRERNAKQVKEVPVLYGSNMILRRGTWTAIRDKVGMRRDIFEDVDTGLCVQEAGGRNAFLPAITVGVAPRRMATSMPAFVQYMACLPRTLLLHKRYGLAAGAAFGYVPAIVTLHAARLLLLRATQPRTPDRVAP